MPTTRRLVTARAYFAVIKQGATGTGFFDDACKEFYLRRLLSCQNAYRVQLHAYILLEEELFLLFTPMTPSGFDSFIRFLNRSYSNYYSIRFARTVKAWRDEPSICLLPSDKLILDCQKFVERYVIDSEREVHPGRYRYSSYCANAFALNPNGLKRHRVFVRFMAEESGCLQEYRKFIATPFRIEYQLFLRGRLLSGRPLLNHKTASRLEKIGSLTDIEKNGTMAII